LGFFSREYSSKYERPKSPLDDERLKAILDRDKRVSSSFEIPQGQKACLSDRFEGEQLAGNEEIELCYAPIPNQHPRQQKSSMA
jgi:hypothetical protein